MSRTYYFRQGENYTGTSTPYAGTSDAEIWSDSADTNYGTANEEIVWDLSPNRWGLLKFDSIFGALADGKIPLGSKIINAYVYGHFQNTQNTPTDQGICHEMLIDWTASTVTWNNLGGTAGPTADVDYDSATLSLLPYVVQPDPTPPTFKYGQWDVTASIVKWCAETATNYGWILEPKSSSGTGPKSSKYTYGGTEIQYRIQLVVEFDPPYPVKTCDEFFDSYINPRGF